MRLPERPPEFQHLLKQTSESPERFAAILAHSTSAPDGAYIYWDDLRHRRPPDGLTLAEWWLAVKLSRLTQRRELPLRSTDGSRFRYSLPDRVLEQLHLVDQRASGEIVLSETVADEGSRRRYLVNSLMEEAIASSQIEGASTTRKVAKEMLRTGRRPRDVSERMILNNYRAIMRIGELRDEPLTPDRVLELHRIVTDGTLENPECAGRLQQPGDARVAVYDPADNTLLHSPPPAEELPGRLEQLCAFANANPPDPFIHPVVRAIIVHLWLAYDHPFEDGNGRTARALFYWVMVSQGYWLTEYVSISRLLNRAQAQYRRSFLLTEMDEFDATYFIAYQLNVMIRAIEELHAYLRTKMRELQQTERLLQRSELNHRQLALLSHALRHPDADYTYHSHATSHRVVRQSARRDLLELAEQGYLQQRKVGRTVHFRPVEDLAGRLSEAGPAQP